MRVLTSSAVTALLFASFGGYAAAGPFKRDDNQPANDSVVVDASLIVDLGYVRYQGIQKAPNSDAFGQHVKSWYAIRYAASPEGARRWATPVSIESSNNYSSTQVLDATKIGPQCLNGYPAYVNPSSAAPGSLPGLPSPNGTSEDCLLLNIHKPLNPISNKLPVVVQIHGGGYIQGSAETAMGEVLVSRSAGSIIYIEIQYRLGGLGFLSGSAVRSNGTANAGYADQRSALEWVQRNIAAFGGDPAKVTVAGGSAGGGSVAAQMQLFGGVASPPFRAAIAEYPGIIQHHNDTFLQRQYNLLLQLAGCTNLACLRGLSFQTLSAAINQTYITAYQRGDYGFDENYYQPSVDGTLIRELPSIAFTNGRFSKVPFLSNHNGLEGLAFVNSSIRSDADIRAGLRGLYPGALTSFFDEIDRYYPASDFSGSYFEQPILKDLASTSIRGQEVRVIVPGLGQNYDARNAYYFKAAQIFADLAIVCPSQWLAAGVANQSSPSAPAYKLNYYSGLYIHGAVDITTLDPVIFVSDPNEAKALMAYFIAFATDLDPNKGPIALQRQIWPQYGTAGNVLNANQTNIFSAARDQDINPRCQFWLASNQIIRS